MTGEMARMLWRGVPAREVRMMVAGGKLRGAERTHRWMSHLCARPGGANEPCGNRRASCAPLGRVLSGPDFRWVRRSCGSRLPTGYFQLPLRGRTWSGLLLPYSACRKAGGSGQPLRGCGAIAGRWRNPVGVGGLSGDDPG